MKCSAGLGGVAQVVFGVQIVWKRWARCLVRLGYMQLSDRVCSGDGREGNLLPRTKHWCATYSQRGHNMRNHQTLLTPSTVRNKIRKHILFR